MGDTELQQLAKTDRNPSQESRYKELLAQQGLPYFAGGNGIQTSSMPSAFGVGSFGGGALAGGAGGLNSIVDAAKQLAQFTTEQNKPVIASMEAQRQPLVDRYNALLDQITGNQKTAENRQTIATSSELGRRGISAESGLFGQTVANAVNPITQQYTDVYKQTAAGRESDLATLASQIAGLQAGNPQSAISNALQFGNYQQGAQQLAANIANQQQSQQIAQQQLAVQQAAQQLAQDKFNINPWGA